MAVKLLLILSLAVVAVSSAGILETLLSWDVQEAEGKSSTPQSKCLCQSSGCLCCVDFNLTSTFILGGPACVNIKQKDNNVSLNLNYGDNPVHNATIRTADAANKPTCMDVLSGLAQLCAKFTVIKRQEQSGGYDGCLVIEPALMRSPQATYHIGCFNFNQGVKQIQPLPSEVTAAPAAPDTLPEEEEDEDAGLNPEEFIAVVSASAEQGFALFSQWLGINLNLKNLTANRDTASEPNTRHENTSTTSRSSRNIQHAQVSPEDKSDERFKQLLSAQDNIVKESARIGHADSGHTTFVYAQRAPDASGKSNLPVVPRESRRGGRAYNIRQHVNEV